MAFTLSYQPSEDQPTAKTESSSSRRSPAGEVKWVVVQETAGLLPAKITADSLQAYGIPARAWQESVGQAYGMTIGPLGTGYVLVPAGWATEARQLLEDGESQLEPTTPEP